MSNANFGERADSETRRVWMAVLAKAAPGEIEAAWETLDPKPDYTLLRNPEPGMVMVRGRAGGTGQAFNFGEMTVTRCAVRSADGFNGFAYVAGRDRRHAELAAVFDALMQAPDRRDEIDASVIAPLQRSQEARRAERGRKAAATRVDFFTMVRGEDEKP